MKTISLKRILVVLAAFFTALLLLITPTVQASADETSDIRYTDVLEDLKRDKDFDESKYVAKADDYSLSVIHIAENKARELLIYVYRPSAGNEKYDCTAKKISLSKTVGDDVDYSSYNLTLVDNSGVFDKYKVENFTTEAKSIRYYSISMISRKGYTDIDGSSNGIGSIIQSTLGFRSYAVGQRWRVTTANGNVTYRCENEEVITITTQLVGHIRYKLGLFGVNGDCNAFFVAFDTDKSIDDLLKATVTFNVERTTIIESAGSSSKKVKQTENKRYLSADDKATNPAGIFGKKYTWERIQTTEKLLSEKNLEDLNLSKNVQGDLKNTKWVLYFYEAENSIHSMSTVGGNVTITKVTEKPYDVAILQLTFITDGVTYTMGVVDNYNTPDEVPEGVADTKGDDFKAWLKEEFSNFWDKTKTALKIVVVILCLVLLGVFIIPFLPFIFQLLGTLVKWLLKGAWWLICFPFNLIGKLFKKKNKKNDDKK